MSEYIDRCSLLIHIAGVKICLQGKGEWISGFHDGLKAVGEMVQNFPAADVVEVKHGRWELYGNDDGCGCSYFCDKCGANYDEDWFYEHGQFNFCPNCGADMRDGGKDNG